MFQVSDSTSYTYRDKAKRPKVEAKQKVLKISLFSAGVTGDLYTCQTCKQIFGSSRELKLHSAKDHDSFNLSRAFASNSRRDATGKVCKVHIFWEGHKILQNLPLTFV